MENGAIKKAVLSAVGLLGSMTAAALGGWSSALTTLVICMAVDYATGLVVAGVFRRSKKSENGALESRAGFKGLCRKGMLLAVVLVANRLDMAMGSQFIRDAAVIAFIANETISIVENAGLMGVPIPRVITEAIDALKGQGEV